MTASPSQEQPAAPALHPNRRNVHWLIIQFALRLIFGVWLRFRTRGIERVAREGGGLVLVNHQSFLDPCLIAVPLQRPVSFLARDTLFPIPFVGWVLRNTYTMPINRDDAIASNTIFKYRSSKMLSGNCPLGRMTAPGRGNTGKTSGSSLNG